jgi:hypothetical protein
LTFFAKNLRINTFVAHTLNPEQGGQSFTTHLIALTILRQLVGEKTRI